MSFNIADLQIVDLLPHDPPMLMLERILSYDENRLSVTACISPESPFANNDGRISNCIAIEIMAQAAAVYGGLQQYQLHKPMKSGLLISAKHVELNCKALSSATTYTVHAQHYHSTDSLAIFDCTLEQESTLAKAQLHVLQVSNKDD